MRIRYLRMKDDVGKMERKMERLRRREAEKRVKRDEEVWFTTLAQLEVRKGSESRGCAELKGIPEEDTFFVDVLNELDEDE